MLSYFASLFRKRLHRWLAGGVLVFVSLGAAAFINTSAVGATGDKTMKSYQSDLPVLGKLPSLGGASAWLNSPPLDAAQLHGKVVLVDFWTYSCINCIRTLPHVRAWADQYCNQGLIVIGVHTPEFDFEKDNANIKKAVERFKLDYPIAIDSDHHVWDAFHNNAWPVFYIVDAQGQIRARLVGEGNYEKAETIIQSLLSEAGKHDAAGPLTVPQANAELAAPDIAHLGSDETYVGYAQTANFVSRNGLRRDVATDYINGVPDLNEWSLTGNWTVAAESASLNQVGGSIIYRFNARDLHLVLGPRAGGAAVRFQVKIDGHTPGSDHGSDADADGNGVVTEARLYQLVRQSGAVRERTFEIRFLDAGVHAFAFTFG